MGQPKPFKLPKAFIKQLEEFTNGFHLTVVNSQNEFETYVWYPNSIAELALLNYIDIQSTATQEIIRQQAIDGVLEDQDDEDREEKQEGPDSDSLS
jgi:hypothetical protein